MGTTSFQQHVLFTAHRFVQRDAFTIPFALNVRSVRTHIEFPAFHLCDRNTRIMSLGISVDCPLPFFRNAGKFLYSFVYADDPRFCIPAFFKVVVASTV